MRLIIEQTLVCADTRSFSLRVARMVKMRALHAVAREGEGLRGRSGGSRGVPSHANPHATLSGSGQWQRLLRDRPGSGRLFGQHAEKLVRRSPGTAFGIPG
jgi:hypothetical protein